MRLNFYQMGTYFDDDDNSLNVEANFTNAFKDLTSLGKMEIFKCLLEAAQEQFDKALKTYLNETVGNRNV